MLNDWIISTRPKTLWAAVGPVMMGAALAWAHDVFHAPSAVAALLGALFIQVGTNFCNDYFDHRQGADTDDRKGIKRPLQEGRITPGQMAAATVTMFLLAAACCGYLVMRAGWPMVVIGVASLICGVWYTAGPLSLAYTGLADVFAFAFFGPVAVAGTYFVQGLSWHPTALLAGCAPGCFAIALLSVNNLRDVEEDRAANKRTLAVRFGRSFVRTEYVAALMLATVIPVYLWLQQDVPVAVMGSSLATVIIGLPIARTILKESSGAALNPALGCTARLLIVYCTLFSLGLLV